MLKLLLKKQMAEIFRSYFYNSKKNRARSKVGTACYILLFIAIMGGLLGGMFAVLSASICGPLAAAGMDWLYFVLMGFLAIFMGTFGSVFNTYSTLYLSKDNDLMLSLPIPVSVLMASRLLSVYFLGLMYSLVVSLPAVVVYWIVAELSVASVLGGLLLTLLISVFVLILSCVLGWVVAKISLRLKHKSFVTVAASLLFLGGYYFVYFKAQQMLQDLVANAAVYGAKIKGAAYPLYLFGQVGVGDVVAMLVVSAVILALLALVWVVMARSFLQIATSSGRTARRVYKEKTVKQKSVSGALLSKEMARFLASSIYMLNCGLGILLMPVAGIFLLWKSSTVISVLNEVFLEWPGCTPVLLCAVVCMLASMNDMVVPSISLEGKSLWLLQSLPVTPWQVLRAKMSLQLLLTGIPTAFCLICLALVYPYSAGELFLTALVLFAYVIFSALFGMFLGVMLPNLSWTNEMTPIKQSISVILAMFGGFAYTILFCAGFLLLDGWKLGYAGYMAMVAAITLVLSALLGLWIRKCGCRRLALL